MQICMETVGSIYSLSDKIHAFPQMIKMWKKQKPQEDSRSYWSLTKGAELNLTGLLQLLVLQSCKRPFFLLGEKSRKLEKGLLLLPLVNKKRPRER